RTTLWDAAALAKPLSPAAARSPSAATRDLAQDAACRVDRWHFCSNRHLFKEIPRSGWLTIPLLATTGAFGMSIRNWPQAERPREKLLALGPAGLTEAELLAILLRTGVPGQSALDLARSLLIEFGSLRGLLTASRTHLCARHGLGTAGYVTLQAALELARRHYQ